MTGALSSSQLTLLSLRYNRISPKEAKALKIANTLTFYDLELTLQPRLNTKSKPFNYALYSFHLRMDVPTENTTQGKPA